MSTAGIVVVIALLWLVAATVLALVLGSVLRRASEHLPPAAPSDEGTHDHADHPRSPAHRA